MTGAWWRRNALALVAVVLLLPLTAVVVGGNEWLDRNVGRPVFPDTRTAGEEPAFGGILFGPVELDETYVVPDGISVPAASRVVVARVRVDRLGTTRPCSVPLLTELDSGREWSSASSEVGWRSVQPPLCPSELFVPVDPSGKPTSTIEGRFWIEVPFLIPRDADGPFGIDIVVADELPGYLRLLPQD